MDAELRRALGDLGERVGDLGERVDSLGQRVDSLGQRVDSLGERVGDLGQRVDSLGERVDGLEQHLGRRVDAVGDEARAARETAIGGAHALALLGEDIRRNNQLLVDTVDAFRASQEASREETRRFHDRLDRLTQDWLRARTDNTERLIVLHEQVRVLAEEMRLMRRAAVAPAPH